MSVPTTQELVAKAKQWEWSRRLQDPKVASGQCFISTEKILNYYYDDFKNQANLEVAFARHHNDPQGRYYEHGQYSNHYAIWHPEEKLVVDYTLSQFAPKARFPWVGTYNEWLRILARAWGVPSTKHLTRSRGILCHCSVVNCMVCE